jgi:hypothetical protein
MVVNGLEGPEERPAVLRKTLPALLPPVAGATIVLCGAAPAIAGPQTTLRFTTVHSVSSGVVFKRFQTETSHGRAFGYLLEADLADPHTSVDLLHPPAVAARRTVTDMVNTQRALAGVNGDFFNIRESHAGVRPTGSANGPEVAAGHERKAAVPNGQRFGPALPAGTSTEDVIGVGADRIARVATLHLDGTVRAGQTVLGLRGLNQYALPVDGIGAFTSDWGTMSRIRATCGTDTRRGARCSPDTTEVTVARGVVTHVGNAVGEGPIPLGTTVLLGREQGADALRTLRLGDPVDLDYHLSASVPVSFRFAIGGYPILRDGRPLADLDTVATAPRTAAGVGQDGHRMYLVVVDGRSERSGGATNAELSLLLARLGADDAVSLDSGGSSTLTVREPGEQTATVRNSPSDGGERSVANGIGVFALP